MRKQGNMTPPKEIAKAKKAGGSSSSGRARICIQTPVAQINKYKNEIMSFAGK
jgi:hypothetical protein